MSGLGLGLGLGLGAHRKGGLLPETKAVIDAAMSAGGEIRYQNQLNTFIGALKAASIWDKFDRLYLANYESIGSRLNLINPAISAININTVLFTDKRGWSVTDPYCALDLNVNLTPGLSNSATKYVNGSGSLMIYLLDSLDMNTTTFAAIIGSHNGWIAQQNYIYKASSDVNVMLFAQYQSTSTLDVRPTVNPGEPIKGLLATSRNTNVSHYLRANKTIYAGNNNNYANNLYINGNVYSLNLNNNGTGSVSPLLNIATPFHAVGGHMTNAEMATLETIVENYLTSIGVVL
jgi:hypothetical protein